MHIFMIIYDVVYTQQLYAAASKIQMSRHGLFRNCHPGDRKSHPSAGHHPWPSNRTAWHGSAGESWNTLKTAVVPMMFGDTKVHIRTRISAYEYTYHLISSHIISYNIVSYSIIPYHIISTHIASYHISYIYIHTSHVI